MSITKHIKFMQTKQFPMPEYNDKIKFGHSMKFRDSVSDDEVHNSVRELQIAGFIVTTNYVESIWNNNYRVHVKSDHTAYKRPSFTEFMRAARLPHPSYTDKNKYGHSMKFYPGTSDNEVRNIAKELQNAGFTIKFRNTQSGALRIHVKAEA